MKDIYLDYQATTPLALEVYKAMQPWLKDDFGNPHSAHKMGRKALTAIEVARNHILKLLPEHGDLIFTSGATEALNLGIFGALSRIDSKRNKVIVLPSEHAAVLDACDHIEKYGLIGHDGVIRHYEIIKVKILSNGLIDLVSLREKIDKQCALVIAMQVNNEIGVVQPIELIADIAHTHGALILCDMVQGYGRIDVLQNIDLAAISAHKIYGPKGIGALWKRKDIMLSANSYGGGQEAGLRSGTLSPALCAGFGHAAHIMQERYEEDDAYIKSLYESILLYLDGWIVNGDQKMRYNGNINIRMDGLDVARLMSDLRYIAFSAGSACASGSGRSSHVLEAIGLSDIQAKNSIRIGFGRYTQKDELIEAIIALDKAAKRQISEIY